MTRRLRLGTTPSPASDPGGGTGRPDAVVHQDNHAARDLYVSGRDQTINNIEYQVVIAPEPARHGVGIRTHAEEVAGLNGLRRHLTSEYLPHPKPASSSPRSWDAPAYRAPPSQLPGGTPANGSRRTVTSCSPGSGPGYRTGGVPRVRNPLETTVDTFRRAHSRSVNKSYA
jgi:hypothetical protein